jgi:Flp pilus assembly protein TadB
MSSGSSEKKTVVPHVAVAMVAGAAFAIVALVNAPGIAYAIVAVVAALCYTLVAMVNRRRD